MNNTTQPDGWLMLLHQLPPKPDYLRVKVWRRLQGLGAVPVKNAAYVLPNTEQAAEDFQWLLKEIEGLGGEATVCVARLVNGMSDTQLQGLFKAARDSDYAQLGEEIRNTIIDAARTDSGEMRSRQRRLRKRFEQIRALDFFEAEGRAATVLQLSELDRVLGHEKVSGKAADRNSIGKGRIWATRPHVGIDRMASAWLIRRFIDPAARFVFVAEGSVRTENELRYDMADADYTHEGDSCTFEVLLERFELHGAGLVALAQIVHDLDLKDGKFKPEEAAGVGAVIEGIKRTAKDDEDRLLRSADVFDALLGVFRSTSAG